MRLWTPQLLFVKERLTSAESTFHPLEVAKKLLHNINTTVRPVRPVPIWLALASKIPHLPPDIKFIGAFVLNSSLQRRPLSSTRNLSASFYWGLLPWCSFLPLMSLTYWPGKFKLWPHKVSTPTYTPNLHLNSCPFYFRRRLTFEHGKVTIVHRPLRDSSIGTARNFLAVWPLMRFSRKLRKGPGRVHILTLSQSTWHTHAPGKWLYCWTHFVQLFISSPFIIMGTPSDAILWKPCSCHHIGKSLHWCCLVTFWQINWYF